jgi:enoyl-CoA hydratase/carnithine racemase
MNEVELQMPLSTAMNALLKDKLSGVVFRDTILHARRWKGPEAVAAGFCDACAPAAQVLGQAIELAKLHAKRGVNQKVYSRLKTMMWLDAKTALTKGGTVEGMSEQMLELRARL